MKLEHLTNKSATNLHSELSSALMKAGEFSIASAFINNEAIELLAASLKKNKKLQGRVLIGLYNFFNKKKDLEALLQLVNSNPARMQVHISLDPCFHWKYYHFVTGQKQTYYIGSANFTTSGMANNRELVVKLSGSKSNPESSIASLSNSFEKEWKNAGTLASFPLDDYKEIMPLPGSGNNTPQSILDFFNKKHEQIGDVIISDKAYVILLRSSAKTSTIKAINNQKPEWSKKGWDWFVLTQKAQYEQCIKTTEIFVFSREERGVIRCYLAERKEECDTINTDDGKYIIAYKDLGTKKLTKKLIEDLKEPPFSIDLTARKEKFYTKTLGRNQVKKMKTLLNY